MFDYHVHTEFSADSSASLAGYLSAAGEKGVRELCFTDHFDLDFPQDPSTKGKSWEADISALCSAIDALQPSTGLLLRKGVEMGVRTEEGVVDKTVAALKDLPLDFVIASVHLVDGVDPYFPAYFEDKSRSEGFARYLECLYDSLTQTDFYQAVGHIDYPSKGCPYERRALAYADAPDVLDALFRHVIERGKCIEINGSVLLRLGEQRPDLAIYRRYTELGGEFITLGSDAHNHGDLAQGLQQAKALAEAAGIRYVATFCEQKAEMYPLASI